ncbi:MAG: hypothetical protein ACPH2K_06725, partial [Flavicella sp.]
SKQAVRSATKAKTRMTEALSLSEEQSAKVYDIMLTKFSKNVEVKAAHADDKVAKKAGLTANSKEAQKALSELLGEEKYAEWKAYLKANKKKKN